MAAILNGNGYQKHTNGSHQNHVGAVLANGSGDSTTTQVAVPRYEELIGTHFATLCFVLYSCLLYFAIF